MPGWLVCARLGCLTSCIVPGVRRLSPALRIAGAMLRLQCKRPHMGGEALCLQCSHPQARGGVHRRWLHSDKARVSAPRPLQMHERQANASVKGRYKSAQACSLPVQNFWAARESVLQVRQVAGRPPRPLHGCE